MLMTVQTRGILLVHYILHDYTTNYTNHSIDKGYTPSTVYIT